MLTNYLRSGVAASTYLPLTGGTVSGLIRRQDNNYNENPNTFYFNILNYQARVNNTATNIPSSQITFTDRPGTFGFPNAVRTSDIYLMTAHNWDGSNYSVYPDTTLSIVANQDGGRIGISKINPAYKLDVNGTFNASGNSLIGGTLGVTGAATFNNTSRFIGNVAINTTTAYIPLEVYANANDFVSVGVKDINPSQYTGIHFGYVEPNTDYRKSAIVFQRRDYTGSGDASGSIHILNTTQGQGSRSADLRDARLTIMNNANVGINDTLPTSTLSVNGTLGVTSTTTLTGALTVNNATVLNEGSGDFDTRIESDGNANMVFVDAGQDRVGIGTGSPSKTLDVNGEVKIATVTATPTALLGKDASNVVGEVTTVAQTGLMTRGSTTATTGTPSAVFNVTHGLGSNPTAVIVTSAGIAGAEKIIFEVYAKNSTTFSVQAWNYDGTEAASTSVTIYWLAIK
jgi:hypothetical protein